jgi:hypothetical protein
VVTVLYRELLDNTVVEIIAYGPTKRVWDHEDRMDGDRSSNTAWMIKSRIKERLETEF